MRKAINVVLGIAIVIGAVFGAKAIIAGKKKRKPKNEKVVPTVFVEQVNNASIPINIKESGRLMAKRRLEIFAEVQGVMEGTGKEFKPGKTYRRGETLVKIRSTDYYANLQAQKSVLQNMITSILPDLRLDYPKAYQRWDAYLKDFRMDRPIQPLPEPTSDKEKFFVTGKNIYTTYYNTKNLEIIYQKYTLRAPFSGILIESQVNQGTLIRPGQKLGTLIDPKLFELEVSVSKSLIPSLSVGQTVSVIDPVNTTLRYEGKIGRVNGMVNTGTQTVQVFIEVKGADLKEGMYLEAVVNGKEKENAFEIERSLLVDNNKVFAINDSVLIMHPVKVVHKTQNTVVVEGLPQGAQILRKSVPGAYSGMQVKIQKEK